TGELALEVVAQSVLVVPAHALAAGLVEQRHRQARAEHGLGAQQVAQRTQVELRAVEILRVRPEAQARAGIALADAAHDLKPARRFAAGEVHAVLVAVALDVDLEPARQRVDHAHADAVQAAGEGVVAVVELAARVQPGQDQFDAGDLLLGVHVHGHAAAVVGNLAGAVGEQDDLDFAGVARKGLVDRVVDHFLGQVVGAAGVGVHARPAADGVEARQDLDICGVIAAAAHAAIVA